MSKCFLIRSYLVLLLLLSANHLNAQTTTPQLLNQSDFTYVGAFKLPVGNFGMPNGTFDYSNAFVSGNVYNDPVNGKSLFIAGYLSGGYVSTQVSWAEVKIPASILDPNVVGINGLTTATVVQGFDDPSNGAGSAAFGGAGGSGGFGSLVVYGEKLLGTESSSYDATCVQSKSAWVSPTNFSQKSQASGPYAFISPVGPRWVGGGFMALIPPEWQSALGGKVVSGNGPVSIISCGSPGPSLHVIDADTLITQPASSTNIASTPLVYYQDGIHSSLGAWNSNLTGQIINGKPVPVITVTDPYLGGQYTIPYEDNSARIQGVLFADGTRSVLFFGVKGLGPYCYGDAPGACNDPASPGHGDHAYPYSQFVWAYDVNDLIAVKNGQKNPWDIYPYTGWTFKAPGSDSTRSVAVAWDPATRLAYMVFPGSWGNSDPVVHVFRVGYGAGSPTPAPTVTISANPISIISGGTSTLSWTSTNATSCTASGAWSGTQATSGSQSTGNLTTTATYSLTCTGAGGSTSQSATVTVTASSALPTVTIAASPSSIISASSSTLSWSSTNATSCTASGAWSGAKATSGSESTGILTANATYTLTCTGAGSSASQSATVTVTSAITTPPPSSTVNVSNVSGLQSAIAGLTSNATVLLADGTYNLTDTLYLPQNISNVTIKGASGNRDAVIIKGPGMTNSAIAFGFWADNVSGITFQDITIRDFNQHAIILNGGVDSPVYRNLHIIDIGDQFLKNNPTADGLNGIDNGILENSLLEYTSTAPDSYTNGLDVHRGKNWTIRNNTFKNFRVAADLAGPAVLVWNGSSDTTVVRNTFINNQRDISLGLDPTKPVDGTTDHARGIIANNFIYKTSSIAPDVPIAVFDSPQTKVYYNTVLVNGGYPNAIEYRFSRTTGVDIKNNLLDAAITARDGATATVANNITNALSALFVNPTAGDLHLKQTATVAIDKGIAVSVTDDFDGEARPQGAASDIGADEYTTSLTAPAAPSSLVLQ